MKFFSAFLPLAIATGALAMPVVERDGVTNITPRASKTSAFTPTPVQCLLPFQATAIVNAFSYLLANPAAPNFSATANALLSDKFTDTSDSINQIAGIPVRLSPSLVP